MGKISDTITEFLMPYADKLGLDILEVTYEKKFDGMNLTIFIDKVGGVNIDDCERFHRSIDEPLDSLDPTNGATYTLNVSSPGLDRPLKTMKDFKRNMLCKIKVKLFAQDERKKKEYVGILNWYDEESFSIDCGGILGTVLFRK
ncbi:MAG: ribosome maturation factor RimP, partial [Clostridia bacterium]